MLSKDQIAIAKGMLNRGDKQHSIAAYFGVNGGRIAEINNGKIGASVQPAPANELPLITSGPRYIDPNAPLDKQIEMLDLLRKNPPENSRRITITPDLAEHILVNVSDTNRARRGASVRKYADDMANGRWRLTGDTIKFGKAGLLRDGQHRLAACVRAGVPFSTFVAFGIDDDAFVAMDIGRNRKGDDTFTIASVPNATTCAAAVRWYKIFTSNNPANRALTFQNRELLETYKALDTAAFDDAVSSAKNACRNQRLITESSLAALVFIYRKKYPTEVDTFLADLIAFKGGAKKLLTSLDAIRKAALGRVHETQRNGMLIQTLNNYVAGKGNARSSINWTDLQSLPVFA